MQRVCRMQLPLLSVSVSCFAHYCTCLQVTSNRPALLPHGTAQPFYHCLVDVRDGEQGPHVSYVAQDNVLLLSKHVTPTTAPAGSEPTHDGGAAGIVLHPLLTRYFSHFRPDSGAFIPVPALEALYPDDSTLSTVAASVAADLGTRGDADAAFAALVSFGSGGPASPSNRSMQLR